MARARLHASASERVAASKAKLEASGGAERRFRLSADSLRRLALLRGQLHAPSDAAVIEKLLRDATEPGGD